MSNTDKPKQACEQLQKFGEHEKVSTRLKFASKSSKAKILRAVKNFNGPFIPPPPLFFSDATVDIAMTSPCTASTHSISVKAFRWRTRSDHVTRKALAVRNNAAYG